MLYLRVSKSVTKNKSRHIRNMETFPSLLQKHATQRANHIALRMKRYGIWNSYTWQEISNEVRKLACGFAAKGLKPGDKIAIIGNNVPPLYFSILAAQSLGAVPVPLHADSTTEELKGLLANCEARFAVLQDQQQVDAIYGAIESLPNLVEVIYFDVRGMQEYDHTHLKSYLELEDAGESFAAEHASFFDDVSSKVTPDSESFIVYTAGTSGTCRGAVHTHSSFITTGQAFLEQEGMSDDEVVFAYLPLSYATTLFFIYTLWMINGHTICCPESNETILIDMREVGPTLFYGPPHFYKAIFSQINARRSAARSKFLDNHMDALMTKGRTWLGDKLVYNPIKDLYGISKIRHAYVGGDVISEGVFSFYRALGVNLKTTYGSAESAGCISVQTEKDMGYEHRESMVGKPLAGIDVKIENYQVMFKGPNSFKGYYGDEARTSQIKNADGWVGTRDIGEIVDGDLHIIERSDSISKFKSGTWFVPKQIENALKASTYIKDALAIGTNRDHMVALIVIDGETVGAWAEMQHMQFTGLRDLATKSEVVELISSHIREINTNITHVGGEGCPQIKRYTILTREFSVTDGEMTRSYKIRRNVIGSNFSTLIDSLYSDANSFDVKDSSGSVVAQMRLETA